MADPLEPADAYDVWARTYDDDDNPLVALVQRVLDRTFPRSPRAVVELGCGTGRNLRQLADRGAEEIVGVDLSRGMLDVARRRVPEARLVEQDASRRLPMPDATTDLVLVSLVLEHLEDPGPVIREAARVLRPGGSLVVLELHPSAFDAGSRAKIRTERGEVLHTAAFRHDGPELDRLARAQGLRCDALHAVHPDPDLTERFPSRRRQGLPWLLVGHWSRPSRSRILPG